MKTKTKKFALMREKLPNAKNSNEINIFNII